MVQWLGLQPSTAEGTGLISGQGSKILKPAYHVARSKNKNVGKQKINLSGIIEAVGIIQAEGCQTG